MTFREGQVVQLVAAGKLNKEIAFELHLTEGTVKEYVHRIFLKTGSSNRTELAVKYLNKSLNGIGSEASAALLKARAK